MKITYDDEGYTSYVYLTPHWVGSLKDTMASEIAVEFDEDGQIIVVRLFEPEERKFEDRLKYVRENPHTKYDEASHSVIVSFVPEPEPKKIIPWQADVDLDEAGQIVAFEMIFANPSLRPKSAREIDGRERLYATGALKYISKFRVSYDDLD
jgi:uncharacterized protein YuzE